MRYAVNPMKSMSFYEDNHLLRRQQTRRVPTIGGLPIGTLHSLAGRFT